MPRVRFTRDFYWHVPERNGRVTIAYKEGMTLLVRTACANEAINRRAAVKAGKPRRKAAEPVMAEVDGGVE